MAGPLTIQRVPRGLLHALNMKGMGQLPSELAGQIVGIFDCTDLYLGDNIRSASGGITLSSDAWATSGQLTVPAGEMWLVNHYSWQCGNTAAGTAADVVGGFIRKFTNGVNVFSSTWQRVTGGAGGIGDGAQGQWFDRPIAVYPGDTFGVIGYNGTWGGNITVTGTVDYFRLEL